MRACLAAVWRAMRWPSAEAIIACARAWTVDASAKDASGKQKTTIQWPGQRAAKEEKP